MFGSLVPLTSYLRYALDHGTDRSQQKKRFLSLYSPWNREPMSGQVLCISQVERKNGYVFQYRVHPMNQIMSCSIGGIDTRHNNTTTVAINALRGGCE